jgi:hypothetical protein
VALHDVRDQLFDAARAHHSRGRQATRHPDRHRFQDGRLHHRAKLWREPVERATEITELDAKQHLLLGGDHQLVTATEGERSWRAAP